MPINIVLVEPEIPQNTGNIARSCAATGSMLHLVGKMGFSIDESRVKRAGLDYWPLVQIRRHGNIEELWDDYPDAKFFYFSTHAPRSYTSAEIPDGSFLVFGKETAGLPRELLEAHRDEALRIPMLGGIRSLNLSNSVAIALYEALRQNGFPGFAGEGDMKGENDG